MKKPYSVVEDILHEICIMQIEKEYRIFEKSDDGGNHIVVAFENKMPTNAREYISNSFHGWRVVFLIVPEGYLNIFHPLSA